MAAAATPARERRSKNRRRRSAARVKGRGGVRIQAPNLVEAYRLAGLATGSARDQVWQRAHAAVADRIAAAKQAQPTLDATEVDADLDRLLELLAQQRNEARRRYAEESKRRPGSAAAIRAKQAADALDAALTRAIVLREQQTRRERDPATRPGKTRKILRETPSEALEAAQRGNLPRELGKTRRRAGDAPRRGVHSSPVFDPSRDIAAQARTATPEQLRASRDALRTAQGEYGEDAALAAVDVRIAGELAKKEDGERDACTYAREHYGVTAAALQERDGLSEERLGRNADEPRAALREIDNMVEQENDAHGPRRSVRQSPRPGPTPIPAVARVGLPPERHFGVGPRSRAARIAAQTADAQRVQDGRRTLQAA